MTHIETTPGPVSDGTAPPRMHDALQQRDMLPETHLVDTGFLDAELLTTTPDQYGFDRSGPTRQDYHWQAQEATGFAAEHFQIDGEQQQATCSAGNTSISRTPAIDHRSTEVIKIKCSTKDCRHCPHLTQCVRSKRQYPRRTLTVRTEQQHNALMAVRHREKTAAFEQEYDRRTGIEGTISRGCGGRAMWGLTASAAATS